MGGDLGCNRVLSWPWWLWDVTIPPGTQALEVLGPRGELQALLRSTRLPLLAAPGLRNWLFLFAPGAERSCFSPFISR